MKRFRPMHFVAAATLLASQLASAQGLDASLDCSADPHQFIAQLIDQKAIEAKPMKTSDKTVSAYGTHSDQHLTALGFPVKAVFGTPARDNAFADKGNDQQMATAQQVSMQTSADAQPAPAKYGVVVMAGSDQVTERLRQMGSPATVKEVLPLVMTAVICQK